MRVSVTRRTLFTYFIICSSFVVTGADDAKQFCRSLGINSPNNSMLSCLFSSSSSTLTDDNEEQMKLYDSCVAALRTGLENIDNELMETIIDNYGVQNNIDFAKMTISELTALFKVLKDFKENKGNFFWLIRDMDHKPETALRLYEYLPFVTWDKIIGHSKYLPSMKHAIKWKEILEHDRYSSWLVHYINWLGKKNDKKVLCKAQTLMAILGFLDQRVLPNDISDEAFSYYLFGKICEKEYSTNFGTSTLWLTEHVQDIKFKHNDLDIIEFLTNQKMIDAPISVLRVIFEPAEEYVEAIFMTTQLWTYPAIVAALAKCETETCAKLTLKVIYLGNKINLGLDFFRALIGRAENNNITRENFMEFFTTLLSIENNLLFSSLSYDDIDSLIALYNWQMNPDNPLPDIVALMKTAIELRWSKVFLYEFLRRTAKIELYAKYYTAFLGVVDDKESYKLTSSLDLLENAKVRNHSLWEKLKAKNIVLPLSALSLVAKHSCVAKECMLHYLTNPDFVSCSVDMLSEIVGYLKETDRFTNLFYYEVFKAASNKQSPIGKAKVMEILGNAEKSVTARHQKARNTD